ncbi:MAG: thrombospondin type 3 repeat-containing protein [candidate division Zixibacteria bacterium]|nr:thrombospondin type 3 repeat-containing protein [candidate division Zixibacteria bacterium]MDH3937513.1 thrombospondin type 3 repeat-containing protein [candidate division Zixibacteria bacterium]MDH4034129.1 thrombospondin type 3 repeat-containing protein [candidate division Zixibacteria bacterium]
MKTAFVCAAVLLLMTVPAMAQGNGSSVTLDEVEGLVNGNIEVGAGTVSFHFGFTNGDGANKAKGITNGFELYGSDSSVTWDLVSYGDEFSWGPWEGDIFFFTSPYWHGVGSDTIGFGASVMLGMGLPPAYSGPALFFEFQFADTASIGGTFCIDSCYFPPNGTWMWAYGSTVGSFPPAWGGPHCYDVVTDYDADGDGIVEPDDNCPWVFNPDQLDGDADGAGDMCDNCIAHVNPDQSDLDADGLGDLCDECPEDAEDDFDSDGICGDIDNCPHNPNPDQVDDDQNGIGDVCQPGCCLNRGDVDRSGGPSPLDIADLVYMADFQFGGGPWPPCMEEADIDGSGAHVIDITDLIWLMEYMFDGGLSPAECP